ncbi:hypothetical protein EVAR_9499_1 [Eumeta japonica]|uniref:Uncharacterized protein n=1 Tax=Eumeta variegata TaxID=151549 RepID=A0A4C1U3X2_EUMVA|nr:hypothetical protein EVAR_9499_1 [Eumeta japonica]
MVRAVTGLTSVEDSSFRERSIRSIEFRSRTVETSTLFSDIDPGPYRNERRYLAPVNDYISGRRPYRREGRRCLCHVIGPLKDYRASGFAFSGLPEWRLYLVESMGGWVYINFGTQKS